MPDKAHKRKRKDTIISSLVVDLVANASEEELDLLIDAQGGTPAEYVAASRDAVSSAVKSFSESDAKSQNSATITPGSDVKWDSFPLEEMYKRNWFEGFTGSMDALRNEAEEILKLFVRQAMPRRRPALLRQRARFRSKMDPYALWAWQCRVLRLANRRELSGKYESGVITEDWLGKLARESCFKDGPQRARKYLERSGIPLVIEAHLPQTHLDGAAFLLPDRSPVIGMTLRHNRLDNFWFVLFHELVHVMKHLRRGRLEDIFDNLDEQPDELEREADQVAGAMLIPDDKWETALARYAQTEESVRAFAEEISINPAVVAGRVRMETGNYCLLGDLIGQGEARKQFPDVLFAQ